MKNQGFRISKRVERPPVELVNAFKGIPVANIGDNMNRRACLNARLRPMNGSPLLGTAITVKTSPGDNLMVYAAIEMARTWRQSSWWTLKVSCPMPLSAS